MKRFLLLFILALVGHAVPISAQTLATAQRQYEQFCQYRDGGNYNTAYNTLFEFCKGVAPLVSRAEKGQNDYQPLRTLLTTAMPEIEQAYSHFTSESNKNNAIIFGQYYLDFESAPVMKGVELDHASGYATMVYNTAAATYNSKDKKRAITYFKAYLKTGERGRRNDVVKFMFLACQQTKDFESAREIIGEFTQNTTDLTMLKGAINMCMTNADYDLMQKCLSRALSIRPNDNELQKLQGIAYEESGEYEEAIQIFEKMKVLSPTSVDVNKHLAVNQFNMGVSYYNAALANENNKRNSKMATEYFTQASKSLEFVVSRETNSMKYSQALALAYLYAGQQDKFEEANTHLVAIGGARVDRDSQPMAISSTTKASATPTPVTPTPATPDDPSPTAKVPPYSEYAKAYVEGEIQKWQEKDAYETIEEYRTRVTEETRNEKAKELIAQAQKDYVTKYTAGINFRKALNLRPYDAENKAFLIESDYGELIVPVPRENNEARTFEKNWNGMSFSSPQYGISDDKIVITALTITSPNGKTYQFNSDKDVTYAETKVDVQFGSLDNSLLASDDGGGKKSKHKTTTVTVGKSDVDKDIPENKLTNDRTFAVVICNENYTAVEPVPMALNDGQVFAEYCKKTLGLPHDNIRLYKDATYGTMLRAIRDIKSIAEAYPNGLKVIFYYAGHGVPDEATKDAYLLPVDADGKHTDEGCYKLSKLYGELGSLGAEQILVFLDACFSGTGRSGEMLASARGVALKAKKSDPNGNMVVFSAASGDETALPYTEKGHGLFTYYLLKKLQESKGNVTLADLGNYISSNVKQKSVVVNHKSQTPTVAPSTSMTSAWSDIRMVK